MATPNEVIKTAENEIGYLEKRSNAQLDSKTANAGEGNFTKFWATMKPSYQGQAWCQCFVDFCFYKAFGDAKAKQLLLMTSGYDYYTPTAAERFVNKKQWYTVPKPGDLIFFCSDSAKKQGRYKGIHHVGLVTKVDNSYVYTTEGNTSDGNEVVPNGGKVCAKKYRLGDVRIAGYGRPKYDEQTKLNEVPIDVGRTGLKIVGAATLNVRDYPETGTVVRTAKSGMVVRPTAKALVNGVYWFKIGDNEWISGKYVTGWVMEQSKWWFVKQGYTYDKNIISFIDGAYYAFDKDGWMITSDRINSDGSIKM